MVSLNTKLNLMILATLYVVTKCDHVTAKAVTTESQQNH